MNTLGYPLPVNDRILEITEARNIECSLVLVFSCAFCTRQNISLSIQDSVMSGLNTSASGSGKNAAAS
ncbi:Ribonuclease III domain-containing protein RNC1 chloroplastic [Zea mays]|uniref:Ribonuclease III domain-containing protein RNC1 chloroplastic n=1 Tax=Zea mays TaxID=4577 RepID=A0A1D6G9Q2_MAIZE|nr:Ribonuclease III domain-containing protein RNC1 chloroplastic [Zea mays]